MSTEFNTVNPPATAVLAGVTFNVSQLGDLLTADPETLSSLQRSLVLKYKNSRSFREWFYRGTDKDPDALLRSLGLTQ
jgi:hypothetical protein